MENTPSNKVNSKLEAITQLKCPKCYKGDMFMYPLSKLHKFYKMHQNCPNCNVRFEPEPGFFFGAMYISYAFNIALMVSIFIAINVLVEAPKLWMYLVFIITPSILFVPINFRISRALMLHLFGGSSYEPEWSKKS